MPNDQEFAVNKNTVNAFGGGVLDYKRLINEFGITPIEEILHEVPKKSVHYYMTRGIMFGHTDLDRILDAIDRKKEFAVITGIKPSSNQCHIGNLVTCREVLHFQKMGGNIFFCIADIESYLDGKTPIKVAEQNAIENIADLLALGLNLDRAYVYRQSQQREVLKLGSLLSAHVTYNTIRSIYGKNRFGVYNAALIKVADILLPQLKLGPTPTVVPIGADQAPHARLTRDLTRKKNMQDIYNFILPSFTYHKLIKGLDNSCKMSKRNPLSVLTLFESTTSIKAKISNAFTGGRNTLQEQKALGGKPYHCRVFDLYNFFFETSDSKLQTIRTKCQEGSLSCGDDKKHLITLIEDFIASHMKKRLDALPKAREIVLERNDAD